MARYHNLKIKLTPRYIEALHELMEAELEMMKDQDKGYAECWSWGVCTVRNFSKPNHLHFEFGDEESRPKGMSWNTCVREKC
ncbi:hypothetical protein [Photobacterium sp. J15]|uniref:hypothetical protein n=1 Tax=Photobacterium sp. J15 TaxID=265901 RepID=UPI0007E2E168|nr:hypothetical protein [Photobacterium sp. J15]